MASTRHGSIAVTLVSWCVVLIIARDERHFQDLAGDEADGVTPTHATTKAG